MPSDRTRTPDTIRRKHSLRVRPATEQSRPEPALNISRLVGGAILGVALLLIAVGAATAHEFTSKDITIAHPWARATPGGVNVGGAFLEIKAAPGKGDRLIGARSPVAGTVEIHSHAIENGIAKMRRVEALPVKGGTSVVLRPGGYHVMLIDLKQPLKEGDSFKMTLSFERSGDIEVDATIEPIGAKGPHGFDSQPGTETPAGHKH